MFPAAREMKIMAEDRLCEGRRDFLERWMRGKWMECEFPSLAAVNIYLPESDTSSILFPRFILHNLYPCASPFPPQNEATCFMSPPPRHCLYPSNVTRDISNSVWWSSKWTETGHLQSKHGQWWVKWVPSENVWVMVRKRVRRWRLEVERKKNVPAMYQF